MNNEPSTSKVTRRSFIKRSVVAAVAVSSLTIFSGLVNATPESPYSPPPACGATRKWVEDKKLPKKGYYLCWYENATGACKAQSGICGVDWINFQDDITVNCETNTDEGTAIRCYLELIA